MTLGERIKKLRRDLELTQQEFCNRIGFKQNSISLVESGKRNISDQAIKSICREFNVNETWLRTGDGEMLKKTPDSIAGQLAIEFGLDEFLQGVVSEYLKLNEEQRQTVRDFVSHIASDMPSASAPAAPARIPSTELTLEQQADQFAAEAAALAWEQFISEKRRESEASSAKESDAG